VGCLVRVESFTTAVEVFIGDENVTNDSGSYPGGHVLKNVDATLLLNVTGTIAAATDAGSCVLVVQPLKVDGFAR